MRKKRQICGVDIFIHKSNPILKDKYYIATYWLEGTKPLADLAWELSVGQSIGNPSARSEFESKGLVECHAARIIINKQFSDPNICAGEVQIAFPVANINFTTDGITQLLVQTMGGQCDIDVITECRLTDIELPKCMQNILKGPKYGLKGMRDYCKVSNDKPLFGGIIKPKVGLCPSAYLGLVKNLIDGGCNFIKEDEILSDPAHCPIDKRLKLISSYIKQSKKRLWYCASIHADHLDVLDRVRLVKKLGINGIHLNFHCGLGVYRSVRELNLPILMHFQKSGDKLIDSYRNAYSISEKLVYKLVAMSGADTLHCGMIGGYMDSDQDDMKEIIHTLGSLNAVPALSCGMHPGLINYIKNTLGHADWLANVGGAIFSHPMGTLAGVKAMRQAIDENYQKEYHAAIAKWGRKENKIQ